MGNNGWSNDTGTRLVLVVGTPFSGIFFYDPTIGAGNLILSIVPAAGTDPYGNTYAQGITVGAAGTASKIVIGETGGSPLIYFPTGRAAVMNSSAIQTIVLGAGIGQYEAVQILGAQDNTQLDAVDSSWLSSSPDGTQQPQILDFYHDPLGVFHFYRIMDFSGNTITGKIIAATPGTGGSRAVPATNETWHAASGLLSASWTVAAISNPLRYRVEGVGTGRQVRLDGGVMTAGAGPWAANGTIFTLPAGYVPAFNHHFVNRSDIDVLAGMDTVNILSSGAVRNGQTFTAAGQSLFFDGMTFPLD